MKLFFSKDFKKKAEKLIKKNSSLRKQFTKQFNLFQENPHHPSLKLHQLKGKRSKQLAIWIKSDLRALCIKNKQGYIFINIITHDQY